MINHFFELEWVKYWTCNGPSQDHIQEYEDT